LQLAEITHDTMESALSWRLYKLAAKHH